MKVCGSLCVSVAAICVAAAVAAFTNPTEDEYFAWVQQKAGPASEALGPAVMSIMAAPILRISTKRLDLHVASIYRTTFEGRQTFYTIGFLHQFQAIRKPLDQSHPGLRHPSYPHVIATAGGKWEPEDGFAWIVPPPNGGDFRVRWEAGRTSTLHPNVVAADQEGRWRPADGYDWVVLPPPPGDFRVHLIASRDLQSAKIVSLLEHRPSFDIEQPARGVAYRTSADCVQPVYRGIEHGATIRFLGETGPTVYREHGIIETLSPHHIFKFETSHSNGIPTEYMMLDGFADERNVSTIVIRKNADFSNSRTVAEYILTPNLISKYHYATNQLGEEEMNKIKLDDTWHLVACGSQPFRH